MVKLIDIWKTVISNHGTTGVRLDEGTLGGDENWPASSLDWLGRKLRRDDKVLVRSLESGKEKSMEPIKVIRNLGIN